MAEVQSITSIKDPHVLEARALTSAAGRRQAQKALLEGEESLTWALEAGFPLEYVLFHDRIGQHPLLDLLRDRGVECFSASEGILKKTTETHYLISFVGVAPLPQEEAPLGDFVLVLDGVQDYGNIGTIVRTACGFGIRDIVATGGDFDLFYKKTVEASRGKVFDVRLKRFATGCAAVDYLKGQGFQVVATSPYGRVLQASAHLEKKPLALIVGNETEGVSEELLQKADLVVQIPMSGQVESLNVGVATGMGAGGRLASRAPTNSRSSSRCCSPSRLMADAGSRLTNAPSRKCGDRRATAWISAGEAPSAAGVPCSARSTQPPASNEAVPKPKRSAARTIRRP